MISLGIGVNGLVCRVDDSPHQLFTNNARNTGCYSGWFVLHVKGTISFRTDPKKPRSIHLFFIKR